MQSQKIYNLEERKISGYEKEYAELIAKGREENRNIQHRYTRQYK